MTMGERIKYCRERLGWTQAKLGEQLGLQKAAINKYEKGEVENIKRSTIKKMAELFAVSPCYLMGWDDKPVHVENVSPVLTSDEEHLLTVFRSLNDEGKKSLIKQAELHAKDEDYTIQANSSPLSENPAM